jgi:hypothetical protein
MWLVAGRECVYTVPSLLHRHEHLGFSSYPTGLYTFYHLHIYTEPEFLNVYGALGSIPRNEFRQPM